MRRIALLTLTHDRGKMAAALAGVAFATTLVLAQIGLYVGFQQNASSLIAYAGGDLWVMPRGTEVLETADKLSAVSRTVVASQPCVARVRGLTITFVFSRKGNGTQDAVMGIGIEPASWPLLPWSLGVGLPQDLLAPNRVAVDRLDLAKLQIVGDPRKATLEVGGETVHIAGVTEGIRSFTLTPYVFMTLQNARRLMRLADDQAHYWLVDLKDRRCAKDVVAALEQRPDLQVRTNDEFRQMTERYWVTGSGAGTALGFAALLGLIVGVVIVGQTLYTLTKEHMRELATLKAVGATQLEIVLFVAWQALFLAVIGGAVGVGMAKGMEHFIAQAGLNIAIDGGVLLLGAGSILLMCGLASLWSIRAVLKLEAAEVFK